MNVAEVINLMERAISAGTAEGSDIASWYRGAAAAYPIIAVSLALRIEDRAVEGSVWFDAYEILAN